MISILLLLQVYIQNFSEILEVSEFQVPPQESVKYSSIQWWASQGRLSIFFFGDSIGDKNRHQEWGNECGPGLHPESLMLTCLHRHSVAQPRIVS
jgi:hypothetical protein